MRACWQFKNGKMRRFDTYAGMSQAAWYYDIGELYRAWDRSLGGYVYYAK
jgi:hypothetical protein